ncbi:MAG: hypothetical protein ACPIA8_01085 [Candidatus Puniceispirillaceae bacterium]
MSASEIGSAICTRNLYWKSLPEQYDDAFIRMWRFCLICSENYFRYAHGMVFQIQLARRIEDVPQTRDYINRDEEKYLKLL